MPAFPPLTNWDDTRLALHRAAQVVAQFRKGYSPKLPNALHLSLYIRPYGLTTGPLSFGRIDLLLATAEIRVMVNGDTHHVPVEGLMPRTLREKLLDVLEGAGIATDSVPPTDDSTTMHVDPGHAAQYAETLWRMAQALMQLRADWLGAVTPLVVWPHGFDASQLWFPGNEPDEHAQPHLNFGFSPGSAGFPRPYLYAYAYPIPDGVYGASLPELARWHNEGWTGVVIDYDTLASLDQPEDALSDALRGVYGVLSEKLGM